MLNKKIISLLNTQVNKELESAYLYLAFSNYFAEKGLNGFSHWYKVQANEEVEHATKFIDYMHDCGMCVELEDIELLDEEFDDDLEVLSKGLQHEKYVTSLIDNIYMCASEEHDFRTMEFLNWFIKEQAEEEKNAQELIDQYTMFVCDCGCGLYELNKELAKREE